MRSPSENGGVVRFEAFEADLRSGELRKRGRRVKLEGKPFQVLAALIRRPGELVTRDELQAELWSADTFVEFDHSLNTAVNKVRAALGDSAREPKFIETLHRRGYRFIAKIEPLCEVMLPEPVRSVPRPASLPAPNVSLRGALLAASASAVVGLAVGVFLTRGAEQRAPFLDLAETETPKSSSPAIAPDEPKPEPPKPQRSQRVSLPDQSKPDPPKAPRRDPEAVQVQRVATAIGAVWGSAQGQQLAWVDRTGQRLEAVGPIVSSIMYPSLSPDEGSVAATVGLDVWVQDASGATSTRISGGQSRDVLPLWSPLGDSILYSAHNGDDRNIYVSAANGTTAAVRLARKSLGQGVVVFDWSRDGRYIVYRQDNSGTRADIGYLERAGEGFDYEQRAFLHSRASEGEPKLSPDSRYIAYCSDETGRREIYVREFPSGEGKVQVSEDGGTQPRWSRDGSEIFFVRKDALMAAPVATEPRLSVGPAEQLFRHEGLRTQWPSQQYDVSGDGRRFLVIERVKPVTAGALIPLSPIPLG